MIYRMDLRGLVKVICQCVLPTNFFNSESLFCPSRGEDASEKCLECIEGCSRGKLWIANCKLFRKIGVRWSTQGLFYSSSWCIEGTAVDQAYIKIIYICSLGLPGHV